jgi:ribonuclease-3 family protein
VEKELNKKELLDQIKTEFQCGKVDIRSYSPLTLAFLGDCVFEIIIRTVIVERGNRPPNRLHKDKAKIVNAATQARMIEVLEEELTEEERNVYHRGRNAKSYTSAKNASITDYRKATGLEALCGYLYLQGRMDRVLELVKNGLHKLELEL